MFDYDMVGVPLIYTQVVTLAVYSWFACSLVGFSQYLDPSQGFEGNTIDLYVPVFSITLFIVMVGWLKVAGQMLNPYGDADGDFMFDVVCSLPSYVASSCPACSYYLMVRYPLEVPLFA